MSLAPFVLWAPRPSSVALMVRPVGGAEATRVAMESDDQGWWHPAEPIPKSATGEFDYGYLLDDDETVLPDPRSRRQPDGVHGWSRSYDPAAHSWADRLWRGRQLAGGIIYELHVGTFTADGTLTAAIERLDHLVELGVDFLELMPVNGFNGPHNWGYDGVLWYTVHEAYGGPAAYQQFVDACHTRGLAVIQDVVYNHLGPSGNYLPRYAPYLNEGGANTWGLSPNLDGEDSDEVRRYILDNALMWMNDYHVDGLRLDAVHALHDTRATHVLEQLAIETASLSAYVGRPLSLIAESDLNSPRLITSREGGGYGLTGQWSDDFHHALYVALTGDATGYYADFDSLAALAKIFETGFFHTGTRSTFRGRVHGQPIDTLRTPTWRLVVCSDNHDQIGNRADGGRLSGRLDVDQLSIAMLVTLLSPFTPMVFMGEEWGARTPWPFFSSHPEPELADLVRSGRVEEFAKMNWNVATVPDPQDEATFRAAKLDWSELDRPEPAELLRRNRRLIEIRRTHPAFSDPRFGEAWTRYDDEAGWIVLGRGNTVMVVNFSDSPSEVPGIESAEALFEIGAVTRRDASVRLGPHSALVAEFR